MMISRVKKGLFYTAAMWVLLAAGTAAQALPLVWGVDPSNSGGSGELLNIDPWTGAVSQAYSLPSISPNDVGVGLAGWSDALYYINGDQDAGQVYVIDPNDGSTADTFGISGGWYVEGLGYWSGTEGSWLYTCGCSVEDMHRYAAADGSGPTFFWSTVYDSKAVAGDNGGRIFSFAKANAGANMYEIFEIDPLNNVAPLGSFAAPSQTIVGMAFDGTYLYASDTQNYLYTMDAGGSLLNTIQLDYTLYALASTEGQPEPVPEPASIALLGLGLAGMGLLRRRKLVA